jgi:cytochrome c-type biogenesis protein CcmI
MTALFIGVALAVAALVYVLFPLFDAVAPLAPRKATRPTAESESAIDALREIEFDRATGKLSDDDYAALKTEYTRTALVELRARESVDPRRSTGVAPGALSTPDAPPADAAEGVITDPAEAAVLRYRAMRRSCDTCGPRPEPDPAFCSSCGKYLRGTCAHCGATIDKPASRFCANCGSSLAA